MVWITRSNITMVHKAVFPAELPTTHTQETESVFKFILRSLAYSIFAGFCTSLIYVVFVQTLSAEFIPESIPLVLSLRYVLERILFGPALETFLLFPIAFTFIFLWELKSKQHDPKSNARSLQTRLFAASATLAVLFTLIHVLNHGVLAWSTLPASWLLMLSLLTPLSQGRPLRAILSSFIIHSGHNGLLLCAVLLMSFFTSPVRYSEASNSLPTINKINVISSL